MIHEPGIKKKIQFTTIYTVRQSMDVPCKTHGKLALLLRIPNLNFMYRRPRPGDANIV